MNPGDAAVLGDNAWGSTRLPTNQRAAVQHCTDPGTPDTVKTKELTNFLVIQLRAMKRARTCLQSYQRESDPRKKEIETGDDLVFMRRSFNKSPAQQREVTWSSYPLDNSRVYIFLCCGWGPDISPLRQKLNSHVINFLTINPTVSCTYPCDLNSNKSLQITHLRLCFFWRLELTCGLIREAFTEKK